MKGISLSTIIIASVIVSIIVGSTLLGGRKAEKKVITTVETTTTTTTPEIQTTTTPEIQTTTTTTTILTTTTTTIPETTTTIKANITENCCNGIDLDLDGIPDLGIDDDEDGLINGEDPDCQVNVKLKAGSNKVCWWTNIPYKNDQDYSSGWFECPEGYFVDFPISLAVKLNDNEDCIILYNEGESIRSMRCGLERDRVLNTYKTRSVKFRFKSGSSAAEGGVLIQEINCSPEEVKGKTMIDLSVKPNETVENGTLITIKAMLSLDRVLNLERNGQLIMSNKSMIIHNWVALEGTFNFTAYWIGDKDYEGSSKTIWVKVFPSAIPPEIKNCSGRISLTLNASSVPINSPVKAEVSGLKNCDGFKVDISKGNCESPPVCECKVSGEGCSCVFISQPKEGEYDYFACIDMNKNGVLESLEYDFKKLIVKLEEIKCNPDRTNLTGLCDARCGASLKCDGKIPGSAECEADGFTRKICSLKCEYSEEDCRNYGEDYECVKGECRKRELLEPCPYECYRLCPLDYEIVKGYMCPSILEKCCRKLELTVQIHYSPLKASYLQGDILYFNVTGQSEVGIERIGLFLEHINETGEVDLNYTNYYSCEGRKICSNTWSVLLNKPFYWQFKGNAIDTKGKGKVSELISVTVSAVTTTTSTTSSTILTTTSTTSIPTTTTTTTTTTIPWKWTPLSLLDALFRFLKNLFRMK